MPIYDGSCLVYKGKVKITAFLLVERCVFLKRFVACFMVHYFWRHCSVHNTIVILLTRFDAAIPRPHCIVGLVFCGLKCGLKYRKMNWNFGLPFMEWVNLYRNQQVSYSLDIRVNSDLSGQLYTKSMPLKISITLSRLLVLYTCLPDVNTLLSYFIGLFLYKKKYKYNKTWATEVPNCKPKCTILQICGHWILHSFVDYDSVIIGYGSGSRFPVSEILKKDEVFIY